MNNILEEKLTLHQKIEKIRAICDVAKKSKKGYNYTYTDITEILANVSAGMKKYSVLLIPSMVPGTSTVEQNVVRNTKIDKTGKVYETVTTEMLFCSQMMFTWINSENPDETIEVPWFITGSMPDCSQSLGSACSYGMRQFLTSFFQIAQSDTDVDAYRSKQKEAEASEDKAIAEQIIAEFDKTVKQYLADNPTKSDEVKKFINKYAKNANYFVIKEPELASKLLSDFKENYIKGE